MRIRNTMGLGLAALVALGGCAASGKGDPYVPPLAGKADFDERIDRRGELVLGPEAAEAAGELTEDFELHGYTIAAPADARIDVEVTQRGSSRALDTTLFVYGPMQEVAAPERLAFDDDGGWGLFSRIEGVRLPEDGHYLVIVGSQDGLGRGRYRLEARCANAACAAPETADACPGEASYWLNNCAEQTLWDAEFEIPRHVALDACVTDPELVRDTYDTSCDVEHPPLWCLSGFEAYQRTILPVCEEQLRPRYAPPPESDVALDRLEVSDALRAALEVDDGDDATEVSVRGYRSSDPGAPLAEVVEAVRRAMRYPALFRAVDPAADFALYPGEHGLDADEVIAALVREAGTEGYTLGQLSTIHPDDWDDVFVFAFDGGVVLALRLATYF